MSEESVLKRVVIKIGGSLLNLPDLAERLNHRIRLLQGLQSIVVVGGGRCADQIRDHDRWSSFCGSEDLVVGHWLAVRAMVFNSYMIEAMLPGAEVSGPKGVETLLADSKTVILEPYEFLSGEADSPRGAMPTSWDVTSDSIALRVARAFRADQLILLKSRDCSRVLMPSEAAELGIVDAYFPIEFQKIPHLPIIYENLRS